MSLFQSPSLNPEWHDVLKIRFVHLVYLNAFFSYGVQGVIECLLIRDKILNLLYRETGKATVTTYLCVVCQHINNLVCMRDHHLIATDLIEYLCGHS